MTDRVRTARGSDRCEQCGKRRDVHATNWFSRDHPFKEPERRLFDEA